MRTIPFLVHRFRIGLSFSDSLTFSRRKKCCAISSFSSRLVMDHKLQWFLFLLCVVRCCVVTEMAKSRSFKSVQSVIEFSTHQLTAREIFFMIRADPLGCFRWCMTHDRESEIYQNYQKWCAAAEKNSGRCECQKPNRRTTLNSKIIIFVMILFW